METKTCFNSLNVFLLSCRLVSVCTVRGRLPPSHHVLHVLAIQHSNQHSNHEGRSVTQTHKINTQAPLTAETLHESIPKYKPTQMQYQGKNFCCYIYCHMCLFFRQ